MKIEYHKWFSTTLNQDMELKSYGHQGRPVIVFPSSRGRFYDYENNGMIDAISAFIESGQIIVFAVDGRDWESWFNDSVGNGDKAWRMEQYDYYVYTEVIPFIQNYEGVDTSSKVITTGCSFGGYHSMNFFIRHPDVVSGVIALSGVYSVHRFVGDYEDKHVIDNDPIRHLRRMDDPVYLQQYRESDIIICVGQGAYEDWMLDQSKQLSHELNAKGIDHWLDIWGHDVNHDWPWWRKQIPYFMNKILNS